MIDRGALRRVAYAASAGDVVMSHIMATRDSVGRAVYVATDGHRMAITPRRDDDEDDDHMLTTTGIVAQYADSGYPPWEDVIRDRPGVDLSADDVRGLIAALGTAMRHIRTLRCDARTAHRDAVQAWEPRMLELRAERDVARKALRSARSSGAGRHEIGELLDLRHAADDSASDYWRARPRAESVPSVVGIGPRIVQVGRRVFTSSTGADLPQHHVDPQYMCDALRQMRGATRICLGSPICIMGESGDIAVVAEMGGSGC